MPAPRKYPDELRDGAVRMVFETRERTGEKRGPLTRVAQQLGSNPETLRNWVKQAEVDAGRRPGTSTEDPSAHRRARARGLRTTPRELDLEERVGFLRGRARPATSALIQFVDQHREEFGVEPVCKVLSQAGVQIARAPTTPPKARPPSARAVRDEMLKVEVQRVRRQPWRLWRPQGLAAAAPRGHHIPRCQVERLMRELGLFGAVRGKTKRTTVPAEVAARPGDLVERQFRAAAPNMLWVADLTYAATWSGFVYVALVMDVFSRRIVGWRCSTSLRTDLASDALEQGLWQRARDGHEVRGLVHHSDRGVQLRFKGWLQHRPVRQGA